ncbi:MAG: protein kinase, partial [Verrucomicrobiota bacterium]
MPAKTPTSSCSQCGAEIPGDAPRDLCPRCLIEAVLSAPDDFLEEEAEDDDITLGAAQLPKVPDHQLKDQIGVGGFGEVYAADQLHPVRRQVAIKVLKQGQNTKQIIRRFEAERQALALMDHPNIATIYDAGETEDKR